MKRKLASIGFVLLVLGFATAAGCGSSERSSLAVDAGSAETGVAPPPQIVGSDAEVLPPECTPPPAPCSGLQCSSDMHDILDCEGHVVETCPADKACAAGACIAPCDATKVNKGSTGCEYFEIVPDTNFAAYGGCFAAFIANTWTTPVTLSVDYGGASLELSKFAYLIAGSGSAITYTPITTGQLPAGEVAVLFLNYVGGPAPNTACPAGTAAAITTFDAATHGTGRGKSFHITASAPVVAYDIYPFGGGKSAMTSASLLLPTSAWDTNYVAVDALGPGNFAEQPTMAIVGQADNTDVTIKPTVALTAGTGVAAAAKGVATTYKVNRGEVLQFTQVDEMAGSVIQSSAPVGLWGGKTGFGIESCCGETAHQQIPPVRALGHEYVAVRYRNRFDGVEESPPWRLIGAADGTLLTYDPAPPPGAPTKLNLGMIAQFSAPGPFVVKSQDADHPFYMSAHMTGAAAFDPGNDGRGDAEFVNVVPSGEFLQSYVFFTDPTYSETNLVLVRTRGRNGFADVNLDCAGPVTGWERIGVCHKYEFARVDLVRRNFEKQGNCDNGRHEIRSGGPFGLTVWGWGSGATGGFNTQYVSYAYPAGMGLQPINNVVASVK